MSLPSSSQQWDPRQYAEQARFVSDLGLPVLEWLRPQPGETILDLGCGDGVLTMQLVQRGCTVVGVDSSPEMVAAARSKGLTAQVMDGEALTFTDEFDAVFSNAALHWMTHPERVIAAVWRALKPGGRFVGEFGGFSNVAAIVSAIEAALAARGLSVPRPWFFPRSEEYKALLEAQGFMVNTIELIPRPTPLPGNIGGWLEVFAQPYLSIVSAGERGRFIADIVECLRPTHCDVKGRWTADYVRLRFYATKP